MFLIKRYLNIKQRYNFKGKLFLYIYKVRILIPFMIVISSLYVLLANAVTFRRDKSLSFNRVTILILLYSTLLGFNSFYVTSLDTGIGIFGGLFHSTAITQSFVVFIFILSIIILQLTSFYPRRLYNIMISLIYNELHLKDIKKAHLTQEGLNEFQNIKQGMNKGRNVYTLNVLSTGDLNYTDAVPEDTFNRIAEYPLVILFILTGAMFLMSSCDIISMYLCIELQSYGLYILATLYRNSELATAAGLTYFLLGGLSSCFILLGSSLLYVNTGLTYLDGIYILYNLTDSIYLESIMTSLRDIKETLNSNEINPIKSFNLALLILSVGYLFKVSSAPFHFWSPDVYDSLPTLVTTFVAIIAKISIFIFLLDLVHYANGGKYEFT